MHRTYKLHSTRNAMCVLSAMALALIGSISSAGATPVLQVNGSGVLTGVLDVVVGVSSYNVAFQAGTCADVFGSCATSAFAFNTESDATAATNSLLSALSGSAFDGNPADVCHPTQCSLYTPFAAPIFPITSFEPYVTLMDLNVFFATPLFVDGPANLPVPTASINSAGFRWAVWSPATTSVPEPPTIALLIPGVLALVFIRQRRKLKLDRT